MGMTTDPRAKPGAPSPRTGAAPPMNGGPPVNLMYDRRIVRGMTFSRIKGGCSPMERPPEKKPPDRKRPRRGPAYSTTPPSMDGRKHMDIQTDVYLEEMVETIPEYDVDTQTDPFLDRPATPLFVPQKPGPDVGTQIEEGDLFDFDEEVEPMVEVLVGRTVEQAWMEVTEEKQLAELHKHQDHFEKIRAAELVATQRMEFSEYRKMEEKKRRVAQEKKRLEEEQKLKELIETQNVATAWLERMNQEVFAYLESKHYFYDLVEREVENLFIPALEADIRVHLEKIALSRNALHCLAEMATVSRRERARNTLNSMVNNIVMGVEARIDQLAILDAEDCVEEVLELVEHLALKYTGSMHHFLPEFLEYFESLEFQVNYEVGCMLRRVVLRQEQEEHVRKEIHQILQRVIEKNAEPPAPPPPAEGEGEGEGEG